MTQLSRNYPASSTKKLFSEAEGSPKKIEAGAAADATQPAHSMVAHVMPEVSDIPRSPQRLEGQLQGSNYA